MANRVFFMNHNQAEAAIGAELQEACLLAASYQLPILWLALFDADDLVNVAVPCENEEGEAISEQVLTCFASLEKARATYGARRERLQKALGSDHAPAAAEWDEFVARLSGSAVQIDLIELWMLYGDNAALDEQIREWLAGLDDTASTQWASFCDQANLDDVDVRRNGVRGYPWNVEIAWQ